MDNVQSPALKGVTIGFILFIAVTMVFGQMDFRDNSEPNGLPPVRIFRGAAGLGSPSPESPCSWTELPHREGEDPRYVPVSFWQNNEVHIVTDDLERCGFPAVTSWLQILNDALHRFAHAHDDFSVDAEQRPFQIAITYGLLHPDSYDSGEWAPEATADFRGRVLPLIYRSRGILARTYAWAMPHLLETWRTLPPDQQMLYINILEHGQEYLASFNYADELQYLLDLEAGVCDDPWPLDLVREYHRLDRSGFVAGPCTHEFVERGPDKHHNPYRKFEAWLFRRVNDGMDVKVMQDFLGRVISHLRSTAK